MGKPTLTIPWGGPASRTRWGLPRFEAPGPNQVDRLTFLGTIYFGPCPERRGEVWLCHDRVARVPRWRGDGPAPIGCDYGAGELAIMLGHIIQIVGCEAPRPSNLRVLSCEFALRQFRGDFEFSVDEVSPRYRAPRVAWRQATALYRAYLNREGSDEGSKGDYGDTWEYTYPH